MAKFVFATSGHAILVDGIINPLVANGTLGTDWDADENMGLRSFGGEYWYHYITWDENYLMLVCKPFQL